MSKKDLRICPDCRAQNVDEIDCWMCNRPLPPDAPTLSVKKPRHADKPVDRAHAALVALMVVMLAGTVTLTGMPFLSGLFLIPALFAVLLGMNQVHGDPAHARSFADRYFDLVVKLLKGLLSATLILIGVCVALVFTCCVIGVIGVVVRR